MAKTNVDGDEELYLGHFGRRGEYHPSKIFFNLILFSCLTVLFFVKFFSFVLRFVCVCVCVREDLTINRK